MKQDRSRCYRPAEPGYPQSEPVQRRYAADRGEVRKPRRDRLRGGKAGRRDRWYGLEERDDFADFKRWWHRQGKDEAGGKDLESREETEAAYAEWVDRDRPTAR